MDDNPDGHGKGKSPESAEYRTDRSPISHAGLRRRREEAGQAPIRLRYWGRNAAAVPFADYADLSSIVLELPLSELAQILPQRFAVKLYNLVQKLLDIPEGPCFPCSLADLIRNRSLLTKLRSKLAHVNHLSELIADPPAVSGRAR